jgi:uncharacterized protein YecT (DUF1311 family)
MAFGPAMAASVDPVEAKYTPAYDRCLATGDAARGVTTAMVDCIGAEYVVQDRALNRSYQRALSGRPAAAAAKLRAAQRAWIAYRDLKCEAENQTGGTIDRIGRTACVLHETVRRNLELEEMLAAR